MSSANFCIMGVDPGLTGALSFYFQNQGAISAEDMPVVAGDIDAATLAARIAQLKPDVAIVELVGAMPRQGLSSTFKFGVGYGMVRGIITAAGVPMPLVTPAKWKRSYGLDADKEKARAMALRLWPTRSDLFGRKKDHGRAEAALLARYGAERIIGGGA
jgi:crossover junction endodeoxyribonuclease RuvC